MTLFNLVTGRKTKEWFKDHAGKMPLFPTYVALLSDKLFVGFVTSAENYTNQCAAKDGVVANLDMDDLSRAIGTFNNIVKEIKKHVDYDKRWVDYPTFLSPPPDAAPEGPNKRAKLPPPLAPPPPLLGATVQAAGAALLDAATVMLAVVVAAAQAAVVVSTPGVPGPASAWAASETPQAPVFTTTKDVRSSLGVRTTPLGPSAPRLESNTAPNTLPRDISAAIPAALSSTDGLTTTSPTSKLSSWPMSRQTKLWSCFLPTVIPRWPCSRTSAI